LPPKDCVKRVIRSGLLALPGKDVLLRLGAGLPAPLKGAVTERVFGAIARARAPGIPLTLTTNLGIARSPSIRLSLSAPATYLFGTAEHYLGERGALALACELAADTAGFVDIGANYGYFSFAVAARHGGRVPIHYFEPNAELFTIIDGNAKRSGRACMTGHRRAIGARDGTARFYLDMADSSQSSLNVPDAAATRYQPVDVELIAFRTFCRTSGLDNLLVKVDVEGAEFAFLEGVGDAARHIAYLIIEVLGPAMGAEFIETAEAQLGMKSYYINDYRLEYAPGKAFRYVPPQYNWLFARQGPAELARRLAGTRLSVAF
jgi:FkbM family methyltransferase